MLDRLAGTADKRPASLTFGRVTEQALGREGLSDWQPPDCKALPYKALSKGGNGTEKSRDVETKD
jgi:hypothetical protein